MNPKLLEWCWAICGFEGFVNGAASYNNKNQANMRYGTYAKQLGATSISPAGFARFPSYAVGFQALCQFWHDAASGLNSAYQPTMTLAEAIAEYAPSSDENNPDEYAAVVCLHAGLQVTDTLQSLLN
jgi:hypothetical protein